jgi:hypothetical protein
MSESIGEVRATAFTLCDDDGNVRAGLRLRDGNPEFIIADHEGQVKVSLRVDENGNSSFLLAKDGNARIGLDCYDDGPSFFIRDSSGNVRIGLDYSEKTGTALIILAPGTDHDRVVLSCSTDDDSARISVRDTNGQTRIEIRSQGDDHSMSMINENSVIETLMAGDSITLMSEGKLRTVSSKRARE